MPRSTRDLRQVIVTDDGTEWRAPGAGTWASAADHMPYALTAEYRRIYGPARSAAMRAMFARYGVPADTYDGPTSTTGCTTGSARWWGPTPTPPRRRRRC